MSTPVEQLPDFVDWAAKRAPAPAAPSRPVVRPMRRREPAAAASAPAASPQLPSVDPRLDSFVNDVMGEASKRGGYTYKLGEGSRTPEQQAQKVAGGFSKTYNSKHLSGRGRDVLAYDSKGSYITRGDDPAYTTLGDVYREKSASAGLPVKWGGDFKDFYDPGHFELDDDTPAQSADLPDFVDWSASQNLPDFVDWSERRAKPDTEEVISTEATVDSKTGRALTLSDPRRKVRPDASTVQLSPAPSAPAIPQRETFDPRTMEGRGQRNRREQLERRPGAYLEVSLPVSDITKVDAGEAVRGLYKSAATARGVPAEFFDEWDKQNNPTGYHIRNGRGEELTAADAYDDSVKGLRLRIDANQVSRIVDDYKASRGTFKRLGDWASSDEESPGEKVLDAAGTALKPVGFAANYVGRVPRAWSTAFWSGYNSGSPSQTARAVLDVYKGDEPGDVAKNPLAEGVRNSAFLGRVNPRLPRLLGGITETVADPANLVPFAAVGRLGKFGSLLRGAEEAGVFDAALSKAKPLGLTLEEVAARASSTAPDDLLRSAGYTVERVAAPNRTAGGAASEVWKITAPDGRVNIARDTSELSDFAEGFAQRAREAVAKPSDVAGLAEARARYEYHVEQAAHAPSRAARENAQALADDYAKEIARLEGGSAPVGADGIDVHPSRFQPRTPVGQFDGPPAPLWKRILSNAKAAVQLPKAKAGFDLSATGRQGLAQVLAHPSYLKEAFVRQVRAFASEDAFNSFRAEIMGRADFEQMRDVGKVFLSSVGPEAEEVFASKLARRIPGVRGSDRAYSAALDSIRVQAWDNYVSSLPEHLRDNPDTLGAIGELINISTGRGVVPILDRTALGKKVVDLLNVPFFSPRNTASKFNLISPVRLAKNMLDPATRPVAYLQLRDASQGLATLGTTLGLLHVAGLDVGLDPRSPDFGKLRVGRAVYDLTGGEGYTVRYLAQMADAVHKGKADDPRRGLVALTRRYLRTQLQPLAAGVVDVREGKDVQGRPVTISGAALDLVTPFVVDDVIKGFQAEGWLGGVKATPGVLGVGVNFYDKPRRERRRGGGGAPATVEPNANYMRLEGERPSSNVEDLRYGALSDEIKNVGKSPLTEDERDDVARFLEQRLSERQFRHFLSGLDETRQMGVVGEGVDAAGEYAARALGSLGLRNAPDSAELIRVMRTLARERRLRPAQFGAASAAGDFGERMMEAALADRKKYSVPDLPGEGPKGEPSAPVGVRPRR